MRSTDPRLARGLANVGNGFPVRAQVKGLDHAEQHPTRCRNVSARAVRCLELAPNEALVRIHKRSGLAPLPKPKRIHDIGIAKIQRLLAQPLKLGLHHVDVKADVVAHQHLDICEESAELVGDLGKRWRLLQVFHRNPMHLLGARVDGNLRPNALRGALCLISEAKLGTQLNHLIALFVGPRRFDVENENIRLAHRPGRVAKGDDIAR